MRYFERFSSNTVAGSGNQHRFSMPGGEVRVGRVFYKITVGGAYAYSLLFSNIIDSTFAKGEESHKNLLCEPWHIHAARIGRCRKIPAQKPLADLTMGEEGTAADLIVGSWQPVTFNGQCEKTVMPGEFFTTDPLTLCFAAGEYLCLELTFSGSVLPYHHETLLPVYRKAADGWHYDVHMPLPGMVGCDRGVRAKIVFLGDSITQGIGTPPNSYAHWTALLAEKWGSQYACWNLGLGYARAEDAASDGAWLYKAKHGDVAVVCLGVNDIFHSGKDAAQIAAHLAQTVRYLTAAGVKVVLQTVPPFDYSGAQRDMWFALNARIKAQLSDRVALLFDVVPVLAESEEAPYTAKFGGHPNAAGCRAWADALYDPLSAYLNQLFP